MTRIALKLHPTVTETSCGALCSFIELGLNDRLCCALFGGQIEHRRGGETITVRMPKCIAAELPEHEQ